MVADCSMKNIITYKNQLNRIAELGWQEIKTTAYIAEQLKAQPLKRGFAKTNSGLLYKIGMGKRSILLRADIDGLKTAHGIAHSCGHSTHMASLMGAFLEAQKWEDELTRQNKALYFLFQPAEETFPSGAVTFTKECSDIVKTLTAAFTIHVRPLMELGHIGLQVGPVWARGDYMEITVTGKMTHIKNNDKGVDALYGASLLVQKIHALQKRYPSIRIGVGVMEAGRQANTVADLAILKGDIRLKNDSQQHMIKKRLFEACSEVERITGTHIALSYFDGYPCVYNDRELTKTVKRSISGTLGLKIITKGLFSYGCEDFAYIASKMPSVTAFIGTGDKHDIHEELCTISDQGTMNAYHYFKAVVLWFVQSQ